MIWLFWAVLWQAAHLAIQNDVIFVGPFDMLGALWQLLPGSFLLADAASFIFKISAGFLMAFVLGILLGWASYACSFVKGSSGTSHAADPFRSRGLLCDPGTDLDRL